MGCSVATEATAVALGVEVRSPTRRRVPLPDQKTHPNQKTLPNQKTFPNQKMAR